MNATLRELQLAEVEMLKAVDDFCKKHNIRYTLYCGTLLGAIRHKGFIPWDDDIDLAMMPEDYRRFLELASEMPAPYVIQTKDTAEAHTTRWIKVYADGTTFMPKDMKPTDCHGGIGMDIYPFVGACRSRFGQRIQDFLIRASGALRSDEGRAAIHAEGHWLHKFADWLPYRFRWWLGGRFLKLAWKDPQTCERMGTIDAAPFCGKYLRSDWDEMTTALFEGREYPVPVKYDKVLRQMYGDYMQLPPESERDTGHEFGRDRIIDLHRDYREYWKDREREA